MSIFSWTIKLIQLRFNVYTLRYLYYRAVLKDIVSLLASQAHQTPWSFNQLLMLLGVWTGAKPCWKMKSASLKSWSAEGSMKCSKMYW